MIATLVNFINLNLLYIKWRDYNIYAHSGWTSDFKTVIDVPTGVLGDEVEISLLSSQRAVIEIVS
jgi:hypothetical protein